MSHTDPKLGMLQPAAADRRPDILRPFAAIAASSMGRSSHAVWPRGPATAATYLGAQAIIRVSASRSNCACETRGRKPFGGFVLSHDFVEAALMRRAGSRYAWSTDCGGLVEEIAALADRRRGARSTLGAGQPAAPEIIGTSVCAW